MKQLIDLTMVIEEGMPVHPAHGRAPLIMPGTRNHHSWRMFNVKNPYDDNDLVSMQNEQIIMCTHSGTHMDACSHGDPETSHSIDRLALDRGYGDAVWLDVSFKYGARAEISAKDLQEAERQANITISKGDIVLIHTGWSQVGDAHQYIHEYMGLSRDAGEWLREKGIKTLGIDTPSPDALGCGLQMPVHMNFLRPRCLGLNDNDYIAIIENVVNINKIQKHRFTFAGAPLPFKDGTGSPIRAIAIVD